MVLLEPLDSLAQLEIEEILELLDLLVQQEIPDLLDQQETLVSRVFQVSKVLLELLDPKVQLALRDRQDREVMQDNLVNLVEEVLPDPLVIEENLEAMACLDSVEIQVIQGSLEQVDFQDRKDLRAQRDLVDSEDCQALPVIKVTPDLRDNLVLEET